MNSLDTPISSAKAVGGRRPSLARWLFVSFILMIASSQLVMFGVVFYREYRKSNELYLSLLRERVRFIVSKNEAGRLAGDFGELTRSLYEISDLDAVLVLDKQCDVLGAAPLNAKPPAKCQENSSKNGWIYIPIDDPYSALAGVGLVQRVGLWGEIWKTFTASYVLFLLYSAILTLILVIWIRRYFSKEIGRVVDSIRRLGTGGREPGIDPEKYPRELVPLYEAMSEAVRNLEDANRKIVEQSRMEALGQIATKVSHDIRSPLAVLSNLSKDFNELPDEKRTLVLEATDRISQIAEDLLKQDRAARNQAQNFSPKSWERVLLRPVLQSLVAEKQVEFSRHGGVSFSIEIRPEATEARVKVEPLELRRMLSNLVNNAVEAVSEKGSISLKLIAEPGWVNIEIADDGRGLTDDEFARVWIHGESVGKKSGNGIGLSSARALVSAWRGTMDMQSKAGLGTVVRISLPLADLDFESKDFGRVDGVLIDDEVLNRRNWEFAARRHGRHVIAVADAQDFWELAKKVGTDTKIFVDARLANGENGFELARSISAQGFSRVYLCTGERPEKFARSDFLAGILGKEFPFDLFQDS